MGRARLSDTGPGPIRAQIDVYGQAFLLFSKKERNTIVRQAMESAGWFWIKAYLPLRFTNFVYQMGYHVSAKYRAYKQRKQGHTIPHVFSGDSRESATQGAHARGRSTAARSVVNIVIPLPTLEYIKKGKTVYAGYGNTSRMNEYIGRVTEAEIKSMAAVVGKEIGRGLQSKWEAREERAPALGSRDNRKRGQGKPRHRAA